MCWNISNQSRRQFDPSSPTTTGHADEVESVVAVTKGFLSALATKSRDDFDKYCVRAGGMALWPPPPMAPRFCTIGAFVEHIFKIEDDINERIWDPEVKVDEMANLAAVWAPFRAKINGVVDHVGVELFILHKINGEWKVTGLADSCRQPTEDERNRAGRHLNDRFDALGDPPRDTKRYEE
ncbi:uncharacterized protein ACLA_041470 [Aspergillus clavatus NRRL 1]|uniref:SnoaL-like domain-containing protein n=1 Tax=Aspergillus clavatus (strain ATCC 1007 / CBS 513.65 / DSM 816 / NCTC 3887 / NRRL 1 / QM 1276 / 107) TaxID=344612 RepID=A1CLA5_ASPCL|nr:uncharacterized protein ACLA_041470 [Aspergillus clavatus NRRL 1]EAW09929.1 conserved hypothetical protein [Aspergillus clavatus NRRL 1]